jgi:hypothetical protein
MSTDGLPKVAAVDARVRLVTAGDVGREGGVYAGTPP